MFRLWQRFKFFAGFLILGTLFVVLWYGMLLYSERYVKEAPVSSREEGTITVPPVLRPGYEDEAAPTEKAGEEKEATPPAEGGLSADGDNDLSVPDGSGEAVSVEKKDKVAAGRDDSGNSGNPEEDAAIIGKPGAEEGANKPKVPETKEEPQPEPEPAPDSRDLAAMMQWLKVEKGDPVFLRIIKSDFLMELWMKPREKESYVVVKRYPIQAMSGKLGPKKKKGDMQAPEGFYRTNAGALNPNSSYHLSFNVGYPNAWDRMNKRTGSLIMVHGSNVSAGCFAMGDEGVEEIYGLVEAFVKTGRGTAGVPIQIYPFVPTPKRLSQVRNNEHYPFWRFLKDAWDWTELHKAPAPVRIGTNVMVLEGNTLSLEGVTERQVYRQAKLPDRWGP